MRSFDIYMMKNGFVMGKKRKDDGKLGDINHIF